MILSPLSEVRVTDVLTACACTPLRRLPSFFFLLIADQFYGRRPIYIVSYSFFFIWLIPCAVAQNMATTLVARFLDGLAGSAFLSVAGGTVGDCFARHELSAPMMIYTASPFIG